MTHYGLNDCTNLSNIIDIMNSLRLEVGCFFVQSRVEYSGDSLMLGLEYSRVFGELPLVFHSSSFVQHSAKYVARLLFHRFELICARIC